MRMVTGRLVGVRVKTTPLVKAPVWILGLPARSLLRSILLTTNPFVKAPLTLQLQALRASSTEMILPLCPPVMP